MSLLEVKDLTIEASFAGRKKADIVSDISFSLEENEKLAIIGKSGEGKTMIALAILGLLPSNCHCRGSICFKGKELLSIDRKEWRYLRSNMISYIPQSAIEYLNPSMRIKTYFEQALKAKGISKQERKAITAKALSAQGFNDIDRLLRLYPFQLSGGMAQKVIIALTKLINPSLIVADEPTKGLDFDSLNIFKASLNHEFNSRAMLIITHDSDLLSFVDRTLILNDDNLREVSYGT